VEAIGVLDLCDEGADTGVGVGKIGVGAPVDLVGLSVCMKLSALALS
jgi:hypothetical protein